MPANFPISAWKVMWVFVMFDLPTLTKEDRKNASTFRGGLQKLGFKMSQFSVYFKPAASYYDADSLGLKIKNILPMEGRVQILKITDKQYLDMKAFYGTTKQKNEPTIKNQLILL